jgi:ABC-type phosphate/phosphonate transport system substrate-binding protein
MIRIRHARAQIALIATMVLALVGCGGDSDSASGQTNDADAPVLYIGGIPDQNVATVERQFELMAASTCAMPQPRIMRRL